MRTNVNAAPKSCQPSPKSKSCTNDSSSSGSRKVFRNQTEPVDVSVPVSASSNDLTVAITKMYDTLLENHKNSKAFLNLHRKTQERDKTSANTSDATTSGNETEAAVAAKKSSVADYLNVLSIDSSPSPASLASTVSTNNANTNANANNEYANRSFLYKSFVNSPTKSHAKSCNQKQDLIFSTLPSPLSPLSPQPSLPPPPPPTQFQNPKQSNCEQQQFMDEDNDDHVQPERSSDDCSNSRPVSLTSLGSFSSHSSSLSNASNKHSSLFLTSIESLNNEDQGSADSGIVQEDSNDDSSLEQRILQEILDTETLYVSDLNEIIQGYLCYWKYECDNCPFKDQLPELFNNIEAIYEFNKKFLDELQSANYDVIQIANTFIKRNNDFSVYTEYCTHYPRTMQLLGELMQNERTGQMFRERQHTLNQSLPLGAYLLKPVQRILKYHLLLQRLSDELNTPMVDLALTTMTSVAFNINQMKRKHEHAVRVQEIQSKLTGWTGDDLTTFGELCAEGTFRLNGSRTQRHVFLFDKMFLITKNKSDSSFSYKFHIMNSNMMLVESVRNEPLSFQVLPFNNPRMQSTFNAKSIEHKREWTMQLKRAILENYDVIIPNHARQLVMQLGSDINLDDYNNNRTKLNDKWSPLKQHYSTPSYLERRCNTRKSYNGVFSTKNRNAGTTNPLKDRSFWRRKSDPNNRSTKSESSKFYVSMKLLSSDADKKNAAAASSSATSTLPNIQLVSNSIRPLTASQPNAILDLIERSKKSESLPRSFQLCDGDETKTACGGGSGDGCGGENATKKTDVTISNDVTKTNGQSQTQIIRTMESSGCGGSGNRVASGEQRVTPGAEAVAAKAAVMKNVAPVSTATTGTTSRNCLRLGSCSVANSCETLNSTDDCPEHRIYRQSIIRFSLIQRLKSILAENETGNVSGSNDNAQMTSSTSSLSLSASSSSASSAPPSSSSSASSSAYHQQHPLTYKQGSKSMGAKIAQTDYADPLKLVRLTPQSPLFSSCQTEPLTATSSATAAAAKKSSFFAKSHASSSGRTTTATTTTATALTTGTGWVQTVISRFE